MCQQREYFSDEEEDELLVNITPICRLCEGRIGVEGSVELELCMECWEVSIVLFLPLMARFESEALRTEHELDEGLRAMGDFLQRMVEEE